MYIIGIDSATPVCSVALATTDRRLIGFIRQESREPASRRLLADLDRMLATAGVERGQNNLIKAVAVTLGPGMFTGIRVGLAIAKTLAQGCGAPLYGFSTLEAAARRWPVTGTVICVLLDARRGEIYSGVYLLREGGPESLRPDKVEPIDNLLADLIRSPWPSIAFSGAGADLHREQIERELGGRAWWIPAPWNGPGADALALAGVDALVTNETGLDPLAAMPVYLRASDAELRNPSENTVGMR